ncbi:hypothetical protein TIFTF001_003606 [Ficus carica]|uniref:Cytochrome P450 n=1 Tax=Ficus carica TaxID=3494 RepID=A0AA88CWA4_FICCA|nr:hypothetical protein TIFTF001_003606 [Ficus carica]
MIISSLKSMSPTEKIPQEISLLFPTFLVFFLPLIFLLSKHLKTSFSKIPPLPPGPLTWPILGNIPQLGSDPLYVTLSRLAKTYGSDIISLKLGAQTLVVGSTPAAAKEILKTLDRILSSRHVPHVFPVKSPELNNFSGGWTFECNDRWKYLRLICRTELFSSKAVQSQG